MRPSTWYTNSRRGRRSVRLLQVPKKFRCWGEGAESMVTSVDADRYPWTNNKRSQIIFAVISIALRSEPLTEKTIVEGSCAVFYRDLSRPQPDTIYTRAEQDNINQPAYGTWTADFMLRQNESRAF